jgi:hypothetical protein
MRTFFVVTTVAALAAPARAQSVWVAPAAQKIRPGDARGSATSVTLEAAGNEFEAFHLVVAGGAAGAAAIRVAADALVDGAGHSISDARVFREAWYDVTTVSNVQGEIGRWPDAMIPTVDEIDGQPRNAFPWDVPAGEQQPMFVEYHVPPSAPAGWYTGAVHVSGGVTADVPVKLYVHAFSLPSTASIRTAFGIGWSDPCTAHVGGYIQCGGDAGTQALNNKYARLALDHRVSLSDIVTSGPLPTTDGSFDWAAWDAVYAPLLDGTLPGRLAGAQLTAVRFAWTPDPAHFTEWAKHFAARGWLDRTFDYTCDEPPAGCDWSAIAPRAALAHAAGPGLPTLVTTTLTLATQNGVAASIDMLVPTVDLLDPMPPASNTRASYDSWLASGSQRRLWMYQSCDSHGCTGPGGPLFSGWPSYMIDAPATQNRAMEWQAWRERVSGELYYDTTYALGRGDAWTNQYYFGGNGDGTLFYPGTPARIGGTSQVPIASLRLKMIRDGQEDYEYFKLLADAGDPAMADQEAAQLSPSAFANATDATAIDAARHRMALRIEALTGQTPPPMSGGSSGGGNGANGGNGGSGGSGGSGGNGATPTAPVGGAKDPTPVRSPALSGGGSHAGTATGGCSHAYGHRAAVTPWSLALLAIMALPLARRRARRPRVASAPRSW